jgi:HAE1 family hydrophobic/amphiphilic exporter-1
VNRLAALSLRNRALIALATVMVAIFGTISLSSLKQELIPSLEFPVVAVVAPYPGASPEVVEELVTGPVEESVGAVDGLDGTDSTSSAGLALVVVTLTYGTDLDAAQQEVEQAVNGLSALPEGVEPTVFAGSLDDFPIVQLSVTSDTDTTELASRLEKTALPELRAIEGVREVTLTGTATPRVEVELDQRAAAAAGVSAATVAEALRANGSTVPAGSLTEDARSLPVQVGSPLESLADVRELPLTGADGGLVRLGEVADVRNGTAPTTSVSRTDGQDSLSISITKTPDGNTVDVSHEVAELLPEVAEQIGDDASFSVVFDQAPFIEKSIEDLTTEGGLGLLFAIVVILLFLLSVRSTLVTAVSIPLSLLVTFIGLEVGGYSLNILTLGGLTVAIGRVVDDSIVVIENIKRHLSYGEPKMRAIVDAVKEVAGAITSSTLATIAVFLPIAVVGGQVGELFRPFAVTVSLALAASLLVSLTIVPVLASWFLKAPAGPVDVADVRARADEQERRGLLQRTYVPVLRGTIAHPSSRWPSRSPSSSARSP